MNPIYLQLAIGVGTLVVSAFSVYFVSRNLKLSQETLSQKAYKEFAEQQAKQIDTLIKEVGTLKAEVKGLVEEKFSLLEKLFEKKS